MDNTDTFNPYTAPSGELIAAPSLRRARIEKKLLVVPKDWQSPPICLVTGSTEDLLSKRRRLVWLHPAWLLLFLVLRFWGLLILIFLQRSGKINYRISRGAASRYKKRLWIKSGICLTGLGLAFTGFRGGEKTALLIFVGCMLVLLSVVFGYTMCRRFYAGRIAGDYIWLAGLRPEVMQEIVRLEEQLADQRQPVAPEWGAPPTSSAPPPVPW